jgi:hypothetical protein
MDQKGEYDQREKNMVFLNLMLAAFVEDVVKGCAAKRDDVADQTKLVGEVKDDILRIMKKRFPGNRLACRKNKDCAPDGQCNSGVCVYGLPGFTWP